MLCVVVMDDDVLNMPNWGYYEPFRGGHLGLQLMPGITERDTKPFLPGRDPAMLMGANGTFHPRDCAVSEAPMPLNYVRDNWREERGERRERKWERETVLKNSVCMGIYNILCHARFKQYI